MKGCIFHLTQSTWCKVQEWNLVNHCCDWSFQSVLCSVGWISIFHINKSTGNYHIFTRQQHRRTWTPFTLKYNLCYRYSTFKTFLLPSIHTLFVVNNPPFPLGAPSVDNSEYMRNGDYVPTRLQAQQDAVNTICRFKLRSNPENNVGLLTLAKWVDEVMMECTSGRLRCRIN